MIIADTVVQFSKLAHAKCAFLKGNPLGFLIASAMAGAYVGIGIILIFSVGESVDPAIRNLIMGCSFGIALTLVIFAGAELFTGHTMYLTFGLLSGSVGTSCAARCCAATWFGNLAGCVLLAIVFVLGGGGDILKPGAELVFAVSAKKMNASAVELIARGMLCNWLVCLAIWTSGRTTSDSAKCILIFWCLFAFIASGFEHSVANMTLFSIALLSDHPDTISYAGAAWNLMWVTLGNTLSGAGIMGLGYWLVGGRLTSQQVRVSAEIDAEHESHRHS